MIPEAKRLVTAAEGFLQLGMPEEAWDELEEIDPELAHLAEVLLLRILILNALKRWEAATIIGESAIEKYPQLGELYLATAYAERRFRNIKDALVILLTGEAILEKNPLFHYNVACYECQLGNLGAARARLTQAFYLDKSYRLTALEDADLEPLLGTF